MGAQSFLAALYSGVGEQKVNKQNALLVIWISQCRMAALLASPGSLMLLTSLTFPYHMLMWAELSGISSQII